MCFVTERNESPVSEEDPVDIEETPTKSGHPVNEYFKCVNLFRQQLKCKLCGCTTIQASLCRKIEHLLQTDTGSAKSCKPTKSLLEMEEQEVLLTALKELDDSVQKKRKSKEQRKLAASGLRCPKR